MRIMNFVYFFTFLVGNIFAQDAFNTYRLPLGDPQTKMSFCAVKPDQILETRSNQELSFEQLIERLRKNRIILIGESHTHYRHHQVQLKIINGLIDAGQKVCLALEMFTPAQNQVLDDFINGKIPEETFQMQSDYFNVWGHNYRYYQPIFQFARDKGIKMYGINIESQYARRVGRGGMKALSESELASLPMIDTTSAEHRFYFNTTMEGMEAVAPDQFRNIYQAQCLWDAAMGNGAIKVANENPLSNVIVLAGSGHVVYGLGIARIISLRSKLSQTSVICIDVPDTLQESVMMQVKKQIDQQKTETQRNIPPVMGISDSQQSAPYTIVIRSLADFLWGVTEQKKGLYPSFGFSVREKSTEGFEVSRVVPQSLAADWGIKTGDVIIAVDGKDFSDRAHLKKYLSFKDWKDTISIQIIRDKNELELSFEIITP
ncbi:MAG: ChaN family lipoprotein [bacterium]|nr:ChaN family lipoprotein [bacterium]